MDDYQNPVLISALRHAESAGVNVSQEQLELVRTITHQQEDTDRNDGAFGRGSAICPAGHPWQAGWSTDEAGQKHVSPDTCKEEGCGLGWVATMSIGDDGPKGDWVNRDLEEVLLISNEVSRREKAGAEELGVAALMERVRQPLALVPDADLRIKLYPILSSHLEKGSIVIDVDGDYRLLNGSAFGVGKQPIKLASVGHEAQAERLLTSKGL